jgi:hypothetical protein
MSQINLPTPALYFTCILVAKAVCSSGPLGPMAELNFLIQVASVGRGVGRFLVVGTLLSQVSIYLEQNFSMYMWQLILT